MTPAELASWIQSQTLRGATEFVLRHVIHGNRGDELADVGSWGAPDGKFSEAKELAIEIQSAARTDAADTGGPQMYALFAKLPDGETARTRWRVEGERIVEDAGPTEQPNVIGMQSQLMRHLEAKERTNLQKDQLLVSLASTTIESKDRENERLRARITELESRELEITVKYQDLLNEENDRKIAMLKASREDEQKARMMERAEPALAAIMAQLAGIKLTPLGGESALDSFLFSISQDQWSAIHEKLTPEQRTALDLLIRERVAAGTGSGPSAGEAAGANGVSP